MSPQSERALSEVAAHHELVLEGARNLLVDCLKLKPGDTLAIIAEQPHFARSTPEVGEAIAEAAQGLGVEAETLTIAQTYKSSDCPQDVTEAMERHDGVVFLGILGDQLRFDPLPGESAKAVCYLPDTSYFADAFARAPYGLYCEIEQRISKIFQGAETYRITCPLGTRLEGDLSAFSGPEIMKLIPFSVALFPMMIYPPMIGGDLTGRLAIGPWLTSTALKHHDGRALMVNAPVFADIVNSRVGALSGNPKEIGKVRDHFLRIGKLSDGDPLNVNSWHAGINPRTFYKHPATDDLERWGDIAYGSPRVTHFHCCGDGQGDVSITIFDATVTVDDQLLWKNGNFVFLDQPEQRDLLNRYPGFEEAFDMRRDIGI